MIVIPASGMGMCTAAWIKAPVGRDSSMRRGVLSGDRVVTRGRLAGDSDMGGYCQRMGIGSSPVWVTGWSQFGQRFVSEWSCVSHWSHSYVGMWMTGVSMNDRSFGVKPNAMLDNN